ncbi:unnamed protein product [Rotaria sordida]|uniref:Uncharacterized protein n=1 Tax=Rotaria sordida TaxID=392033 RepID=A0A820GWG0_9BILA|nr:unnamed protein product [Rotaria sordida]CAF4284045.1 unnamed protein product [Rotaria sordida]
MSSSNIFKSNIYGQKLRRELNYLTNEFEQTFIRSQTHQKFERQQKYALDITIQQIARERKGHLLSTKFEQKPIQRFPKK